MKKIWTFVFLIAIVLAFYVGAAIYKGQPMANLHESVTQKINKTHVIKFKSGFIVKEFNNNNELVDEWQMKREGIYDAWSKYVNIKNVKQFVYDDDKEKYEEKTSLSFDDPSNNIRLLPIKETYFKNNMYFTLDRELDRWSYQPKETYDTLELLPFHAELLNRYAKHYKSENRGKFVVFFYSVDPNYLTRVFPDILKGMDYDFPYRFTEGTIKMLIYPDTMLPRRIYLLYRIEDLNTGRKVEVNITSYYSEDESYEEEEEPAIPEYLMKLRD